MAQLHAVLGLALLGELEDDRQDLLAVVDDELPHEQVDRLRQPGALDEALVVARVPGLLDHRLAQVALDEQSGLVVHRVVHRPDHVPAAALGQPLLRGPDQRAAPPPRRPRARGSRTCRCPRRAGRRRRASICAEMRPTTRPSRRARNSCATACLKYAFMRRLWNMWRSTRSGGTHCGEVECSRNGSSTNSCRSRRDETGRTSRLTAPTLHVLHDTRRLRQGPRPRALRAAARRARGRHPALLPHARGPGRPRRRDGGRRADHARLEQLPRADRRRARHRGRARGGRRPTAPG